MNSYRRFEIQNAIISLGNAVLKTNQPPPIMGIFEKKPNGGKCWVFVKLLNLFEK